MRDAILFTAIGLVYAVWLSAVIAWFAILPTIGLLWAIGWLR